MWKLVREDIVANYRMMLNIAPLSRTPMDKKGASSLNKLAKTIERNLDSLVPWQSRARVLSEIHGKVESGKVTVLLDSDESADNPLFNKANIKREH